MHWDSRISAFPIRSVQKMAKPFFVLAPRRLNSRAQNNHKFQKSAYAPIFYKHFFMTTANLFDIYTSFVTN